jgi:hypothetical protein
VTLPALMTLMITGYAYLLQVAVHTIIVRIGDQYQVGARLGIKEKKILQ